MNIYLLNDYNLFNYSEWFKCFIILQLNDCFLKYAGLFIYL
jgi:hypothetical protein